jgi:hypothetical protein
MGNNRWTTNEFKPEKYKGATIVFQRLSANRIGARVPKRTSQYLGIGRTKAEAFADAKDSIDRIDSAGNWR